ncbi:unnamed protein product [Mytilus edulis]|uniref:C2H2-type domain-containing protein n=1 Tax=Mytilus edulis TaxID=6550 RepID=A0A8S3PVX5_MYTED|nr:unnamed protein product [Mytilus edulis]
MERNKIHQTTSIVINNYEDEDVTTTEQEERTEVTLSYKQASFPGNLKKNFQNRYFSEKQVYAGSSQSNSPSQEFTLNDLPRYSPSRFTSLEISGSSQTNSPSQELGLKDLTFSKSEMTIGPKEQNIHEYQNTKRQLLHQYSPGFPSPVFMSSADSSLLRPVPKASNIFNFDMPFARFNLDRKVSPAYPMMSTGINLSFPQRPIMDNPMSEIDQLAVSPLGMSSLGMYPSQFFNRSLPKIPRHSVLEQNHHQRRTLSDSDAYSCPVCNQVFFSYDTLAKHMVKHLGTETVPHGDNNNKGHYCSVCNSPERDEHVRKSSVSSTETIDSKSTSSTRTFSQSSLESGEYN